MGVDRVGYAIQRRVGGSARDIGPIPKKETRTHDTDVPLSDVLATASKSNHTRYRVKTRAKTSNMQSFPGWRVLLSLAYNQTRSQGPPPGTVPGTGAGILP